MSWGTKLRIFLKHLVAAKSLESLKKIEEANELKKALGPIDLIAVGIGAIIGTGIFVLTGTAAANHSGPAIVISYLLAGLTSAFAALSYAELASMIPIAGSAYTYTYATMGELIAWIIGWDLILEYLIGAATVAVGWSQYTVSFIEDVFNTTLSSTFTQSPLVFEDNQFILTGNIVNAPAMVVVLCITVLLMFGVKESAMVNDIAVAIKLFVILLFIFACFTHVKVENFQPFIPEREGEKYGVLGVFTGATTVFFAYIGFDTVSTAAQEAKNPQRDMPLGIILSLFICTIFYIAVSIVLVGMANYTTLNTAAPLTDAIRDNLGWRWLTISIEIGVIAGMTSVILASLLGQPRIFHAMAEDGLLPKFIAKIHPKYKTPFMTTLITGIICAAASGVLPIDILGDMSSIGTLVAFVLTNVGVIVLRHTHPEVPRRFRIPGGVPGGYIIPGIGAILSGGLLATAPVSALEHHCVWLAVGFIIYFSYGFHHSYIRYPEREQNEVPTVANGNFIVVKAFKTVAQKRTIEPQETVVADLW